MSSIETFQPAERRYHGVLTARLIAFLVDYLFVGLLMVPLAIVYFVFGVITLGLGFLIAPIPFVVVAALYFMLTLGGERQATPGMRIAGLQIARDDGRMVDPWIALAHIVLFWVFNALISPLILLIGLFTDRSRLLHDILLGTAMHRTP